MTNVTLSGGCLCGDVGYEVEGKLLRFLHCHCRRCRKASGTGHATNIILESDGVEWRDPKNLIKRFKLPDAERFGTTFCSTCGGPLPRVGTGIVVVPAGSADDVANIGPQGRIFWDSRAEWSCEAGSLPAYPEYPTG